MDPTKILLAIDQHASSARAVEYVGQLAQVCGGFQITIIHVIEDPPEDFFETEAARQEYLDRKQKEIRILLENAKARLMEIGVPGAQIRFEAPVKTCESMSSCILDEAEGGYGTLVIGRRGISKSEEFLFGSVSKKIIHYAQNCTVWVVQ